MNRYSCAACNLAIAAMAAVAPLHAIDAGSRKPAAATQAPQAIIDEVWAMEESYWRYVKAADVEKYLTLWNKDFRGWPCADEHPATKVNISDWVRDIRDKKVRFTSALSKEGATSVGGVVVVYYRTSMNYDYPDGHKESVGKPVKITHTWMKVNGRWEIIGGMCGADAPRK